MINVEVQPLTPKARVEAKLSKHER